MNRNHVSRILVVGALAVLVAVNVILLIKPADFDSKGLGVPVDGPMAGPDTSYYEPTTGASDLFPPLTGQIVSDFIAMVFPGSESQLDEDFRGYDRYVVFGGRDDPIGYVYEIQDDLRCPVCNNVRLLVALDAAGEIREIQALEPLELSGDPLPVEDETRFFSQFTSDHRATSYVFGENVDGITGATKSSIHIVDALNRLLFTHRG